VLPAAFHFGSGAPMAGPNYGVADSLDEARAAFRA